MFGIGSSNGYHEILDGIKIKTTNYGTNMIMTEFMLARNAILPEHSHPNEQSGYLVKGRLRLHINGKARELKPGDSWNIAGNTKHKVDILEDSVAIEVFSPVREDYMKYICKEYIKE